MIDKVFCPLVESEIEDIECIENVDCVDGIIKDLNMPYKYKVKKDWEKICKECKYHNI